MAGEAPQAPLPSQMALQPASGGCMDEPAQAVPTGGSGAPYHLGDLQEKTLQEVPGSEALLHHHDVQFVQVPRHGFC